MCKNVFWDVNERSSYFLVSVKRQNKCILGFLVVIGFIRVFAADSLIKGAGQGLFAKMDAESDTVMAFYNGVRITHSEV